MNGNPPDRHQLAVAILAIATAAVGFGLFGHWLQPPEPKPAFEMTKWVMRFIVGSRFVLVSLTILSYFLLLESVSRLLSREKILGTELVNGPIMWLFVEMACLTGLHLTNVLIGLQEIS